MGHKIGTERTQSLLLPERVEDYVGENNPVRFIDAFVDGLDLDAAGFERVKAKATGRPGYDPADMLNPPRAYSGDPQAHRGRTAHSPLSLGQMAFQWLILERPSPHHY